MVTSSVSVWLAAVAFALPGPAGSQALRPYAVVGDAIPDSLTNARGDAMRGRALVVERSSTCILCHNGQLRLRLVDASRLNAGTIMPSYYRTDGLNRVGPAWRGKPILNAEQIEDIVTYLASLRE